jgi:hypothetical protein
LDFARRNLKNWNLKAEMQQLKLANRNLKSRSVKIGICQQKLEKQKLDFFVQSFKPKSK